MRNIKRIDNFCDRLKAVWKQVPDWRFGQLIMNAFGEIQANGRDPFFPEEDEMIKLLENYVSSPSNNQFAKRPNAKSNPGDKVEGTQSTNEWISVKERMPENEDVVLVYSPTNNRIFVGYYIMYKTKSYDWSDWYILTAMQSTKKFKQRVTHWKPLPTPPKKH